MTEEQEVRSLPLLGEPAPDFSQEGAQTQYIPFLNYYYKLSLRKNEKTVNSLLIFY